MNFSHAHGASCKGAGYSDKPSAWDRKHLSQMEQLSMEMKSLLSAKPRHPGSGHRTSIFLPTKDNRMESSFI